MIDLENSLRQELGINQQESPKKPSKYLSKRAFETD